MQAINTYFNFNGLTEAAFAFYRTVFGGEYIACIKVKDIMEPADNSAGCDGNKVIHIALAVGKGSLLMGTDIPEQPGQPMITGNNIYISLHADSEAEAAWLYDMLSAGGRIVTPMQLESGQPHFALVTDRFGIQWMINY